MPNLQFRSNGKGNNPPPCCFWSIPNALTLLRIVLSVTMLLLPIHSKAFIILYLSAGLTDVLDGLAARTLRQTTAIGSRLDMLADFCMFSAMIYKFVPLLLPYQGLLIIAIVIGFIKIVNQVIGFIKQKRAFAFHSVPNKISGVLLFFFPIILLIFEKPYGAGLLCLSAGTAAVHEWYCILKSKAVQEK